jgi:hypothetical protein
MAGGLQEVEAPRHMQMVRLSALNTDRLYPEDKLLILDPRAIV